ncbi:MAG: helix-turn-helix domain-containing protein [Gaiellaceae bacterium]
MIADLRLSETEMAELVELVTAAVLERIGQPPEPSPYLSVAEAAAFARSEKHRVYDLLSAGRLTRFKDGSRVLVSRAELEAYLSGVAQPLPTAPRARTARGRRA